MTYTTQQLIKALQDDYRYRCLEHPDEDDMSPEEYANFLDGHSYEELVELIEEDGEQTLEEFMYQWL